MQTIYEFLDKDVRYRPSVFIIIKPGFLDRSEAILNRFRQDGWEIKKIRTLRLLLSQAKELYKMHKEEKWYNDLCNYMSSGPSTGIIIQKEYPRQGSPDAVRTRAFKEVAEIKDELRKKWGESDMRNVLHSSDSYARFQKEAGIYF